MGLLDVFRSRRKTAVPGLVPGTVVDPSAYPIASPWSSSHLERLIADDVFGAQRPLNTRDAAMRIPTVKRARNLVVSSIAKNPLAAFRVDERLDKQPSWLTAASLGTSPQHRNLWTVDDLMFYGWSCWWRWNGSDGFPVETCRINPGHWAINRDNQVEVNGVPVQPSDVIVFTGIDDGILSHGRDVLDDARALYANVRKRLATPTPGLNLQQTGGRELTDAEIDRMIDRWAAARQGLHGGVSFTSKDIKPDAMSGDDGNLMIESRNAAAVDLARLVGVSAGLVDATTPKASLNYETQTGRNTEFVDRDLDQYMTPIAWRLSMDDVSPRGTRIAWDMAAFTNPVAPPTGPTLED